LAIALPIGLGAAGFAWLLPAAVVYMVIAVCIRLVGRWRLRRQVDKAREEIRVAAALQRVEQES
jgi:hypothetical protein